MNPPQHIRVPVDFVDCHHDHALVWATESVHCPVGVDHRELFPRAFVPAVHGEVTVEARGTRRRRRRVPADPDRHRLRRHREHAAARKVVELATELRVPVMQEALQDVQDLVGTAPTSRPVGADRLELLTQPADSGTKDEPVARDHRQGSYLFCQVKWVAQGDDVDECQVLQARGGGGQCREDAKRIEKWFVDLQLIAVRMRCAVSVVDHHMLRDGDALEADLLHGAGEIDHLVQRLILHRHPELHQSAPGETHLSQVSFCGSPVPMYLARL